MQAILPELQKMVAERGRQLNDFGAIARELGASEQDVRQGLTQMALDGTISQRKDGRFARRAPAPSGPEDVLEFIARKGGIRDDEGHKLGLKSLSPEEAARMISDEARARAVRNRATGSRDWQKMTRRNGPLLRHKGLSIDRVGEALHEAGYLHGADGGRPTTSEVLAYLDQRIGDGKPRYTQEDQGLAPGNAAAIAEAAPGQTPEEALNQAWLRYAANPGPETFSMGLEVPPGVHPVDRMPPWMQEQISFAATWYGKDIMNMDPWISAWARELWRDQKASNMDEALAMAINDYEGMIARDAFDRTDDPWYQEHHDEHAPTDPQRGNQDRPDAQGGGGRAPADGNADQGAPRDGTAGSEPTAPALSDLPREETTTFLDPNGEAAKVQADSLLHDAQAEVAAIDPAMAERQRQEAQLRADAPLRGENRTGQAQDGTMGLGLFDAADQPTFRLDAEGPEMTLPDLLKMLDDEQADIDAMRSCMVPMPAPKPKGE